MSTGNGKKPPDRVCALLPVSTNAILPLTPLARLSPKMIDKDYFDPNIKKGCFINLIIKVFYPAGKSLMNMYNWLLVSGFGSHVKATNTYLTIQKQGVLRDYPLSKLNNIIFIGGHHMNSSVINNSLKAGIHISFFDADYRHTATIHPHRKLFDPDSNIIQKDRGSYKYAIEIFRSSLKSRMLFIEELEKRLDTELMYEGELDILLCSLNEADYIIKIDEIRRIHKLTSDMYYEILSRPLKSSLNYRRRISAGSPDPVNSMLSTGYSVLYAICLRIIIKKGIEPDLGIIHEGENGLILDLIDPIKSLMVDRAVIELAGDLQEEKDYSYNKNRCYLSANLHDKFISILGKDIDQNKISEIVSSYKDTVFRNSPFHVPYW